MAHHHFSNVLILAGCLHATVKLYRCTHLQEQFAALGINATVVDWDGQALPPSTADQYDLLVLQRVVMTAAMQRLVDAMHSQGKLVLFDTDDLVFEPNLIEWHRGAVQLPAAEQELYADGVQRGLAMLNACDAVSTASPLLAELAQRRGKPAFVHRNAVGQAMQALGDQLYAGRRAARLQSSEVIIGYGSGTPTHDVDFEQAVPALLDILTRFANVRLWLMGPLALPPALKLFGERVQTFPLKSWQEYLQQVSQLDIALAPLERDNLFCRAKSEIKFVEAGLLGIPTVATRIDPFVHAIDPGVDGFLAANTAEWIDALATLVTRPDLRQSMGDAARQKVEARYSLAARTADLAATLERLPASTGARAVQPDESASLPTLAHPSPTDDVPLVLNWVMSEPVIGSGGHLGILRMIQHLVAFGHECHIYVVPFDRMYHHSAEQLQREVDTHFLRTGAHFHRWTGRVRDADATIATYWATVDPVLSLPNPGRLYYFVQDFEPSFYPMGADYVRAENTYRQGLHCITLGPWLAKLMRERYQAAADHFDFAVDTAIYRPQELPPADHPRVAFYARPSTPRRAYEIGVEALQLVKQKYPGVEIIFFGANDLQLPAFTVTNVGIRNPYELASLYSSCDVGLVLSLTNPSFVPFEMMACKCAVVDIRSERVEGLLQDRVNARLAAPTPEALAAAVLELLWDKELRTSITANALHQMRPLSWAASARQIEQVLLRHAPPPAERRMQQRVNGSDVDSVLWQIHQVLDQRQETAQQIAHLEATLRRVLNEKAQLQARQQQMAASLTTQPRPANQPLQRLQTLPAQVIGERPAWVQHGKQLSKLVIDATPIRQTMMATASHLCRIELLFAPYAAAHGQAIQLALWDPMQPQTPLAEEIVYARDIQANTPFAFALPPQPFSSGRTYQLTIAALKGEGVFAHALWRAWTTPTDAATRLQRGDETLRGALVHQLGYGTARTQPSPSAPADDAAWATPPIPLTQMAWRNGQARVDEVGRLAQKTVQVVRRNGVMGLAEEVWNYVRWQFQKRVQS